MDSDVESTLTRMRSYAMPGAVPSGTVLITQEGEMRLAPNRPWMRFSAQQRFEAATIEFRWSASFRKGTLHVVDAFERGKGSTTVRAMRILPLGRYRGDAVDKGAAMRGLAEVAWHPASIDDGRIQWQLASEDVLRARFDDGKTVAIVYFSIDAEGRILQASAPDRPSVRGKHIVPCAWSGRCLDYEWFGDVRIPKNAEATWHLPDGDFTYFRCTVTGVSRA